MATDVPMPKLGLTMEEATIIEWLVPDGADVTADQPIVLIETDKTETEVGAPGAGRLHQLGHPGDVFACGERIGVLLADGEPPPTSVSPEMSDTADGSRASSRRPQAPYRDAAEPVATRSAASLRQAQYTARYGRDAAYSTTEGRSQSTGRVLASPNARRVAAERGVSLGSVRGTGPGGRIVSEDVEELPAPAATGRGAVATIAARNLADLLGVDLSQVAPDPADGRVTREAVAIHVRRLLQQGSAPAPERAPSFPLLQQPSETIRLSGMRGTIAKRMHASLQQMAQLTLTMDAEMGAVLADRADRRAAGGSVPSITDYVIAATARALTLHPRLNAQVTESGIALLPEVHVGLAVAVEHGLLVPVVRDAAHRDLADLAAETTRLAEAARSGSISPAELEGGTFSVSALGAYGVDTFTPVINPPNAGILGIGRLRDDVVVVDGEVAMAKRLTLSLTWDHRVVDGVPAAEFCRTIVDLLDDPSQLT